MVTRIIKEIAMPFKITLYFATLASTLFLTSVQAEQTDIPTGLTIERGIANPEQYNFPNDDNIQPDKSDFEIINYVLLSNEEGERWVTVTLKNTASGNRIFDGEQIMALFADGKRFSPIKKSIRFERRETQTFAINFGISHFPILEIYTRN